MKKSTPNPMSAGPVGGRRARQRRALALGLFASVAISILVVAPARHEAFDAKNVEAALASKVVAMQRVVPNYDQTQVDLYLTSAAWQNWNRAHGGNWTAQYDTLTGHARRVYGGAIPWVPGAANSLSGEATAADLERVARDFIGANSALLGVANDRLRFVPEIADPTTEGRMRYAAFDYEIDGVPVVAARLVFAVNNGNMIYWHSTNIADVPAATSPSLSAEAAMAALFSHAGVDPASAKIVSQPSLRLLPRNTSPGGLVAYQLVYEAAFRLGGGLSTWAGYVDALTGAVVAFGDVNRYQEPRTFATGRVSGGIRPARADDAEVVRSFSFAQVDAGEEKLTANLNGIFKFTGGAVSAGLNGVYFNDNCVSCLKSEQEQTPWQAYVSSYGNGQLAFGAGGRDIAVSGQATKSFGNGTSTPAERTAFYHTNVARLMAKKWLDLLWLNDSNVGINVNINAVCNASWDGSGLNFYKAGFSGTTFCNNTGEIRDVMQHEWGHGIDDNDGLDPGYALALGFGDLATGEGVGDHVALFVDHDPCIGQSFQRNRNMGVYLTEPDAKQLAICDGVRDVDELRATRGTLSIANVTQKCPGPPVVPSQPLYLLYIGPLVREGHCEGEIYGQFGWHLVEDLMSGTQYGTVTLDANKQHVTYAGDPLPAAADGSPNPGFGRDRAWTIHERLFFHSRPLVGSYAPSRHQAIGPSAYDAYIVVDDEGDGLSNGTPHAAYINDAAMHHGIEEFGLPGGRPSAIDARNCATLENASLTLSQGLDREAGVPAVNLSWTPVAGAASYSVLRSERRHDVFLEVGRVESGTTSFSDVGVDNGVSYLYRVQANGAGACYTSSPGQPASISIKQPATSVSSVALTDASPLGNGDGGLDPGDNARITVTLKNTGLTGLTGVTARLTSITPGVTVATQEARSYQQMPVGASAVSSPSYTVSLARDGKLCGQNANFILSIKSDQGELVDSLSLPVGSDGTSCVVNKARWVQPTSVTITSDKVSATCGDGDLVPDPGETFEVRVEINNAGTTDAPDATVGLSFNKPYLTVVGSTSVSAGPVAAQGAETKAITFRVAVSRSAPFNDTATMIATATSPYQPAVNTLTADTAVNRDKVVRDLAYDFETGAQGWTSSDPALGWKLASMQATTGNLSNMWHSQYTASSCQYLSSPEFEFSAASRLGFDVAYLTEFDGAAYDGVDVQVSVDGGKTWINVEPEEGYPAARASTTTCPSAPAFFGGIGPKMTRYNINLADFAGRKGQVRFRFGADPLVSVPNGGGWVDNVSATGIVVATQSKPCP